MEMRASGVPADKGMDTTPNCSPGTSDRAVLPVHGPGSVHAADQTCDHVTPWARTPALISLLGSQVLKCGIRKIF